MTEELEKKLNELLGLKKQLEEITGQEYQKEIASVAQKYEKEIKSARIRFAIGVTIGIIFIWLGAIGVCAEDTWIMNHKAGFEIRLILTVIGFVGGIVIPITSKLGLRISQNKLAILQEMKQFELRITEMLKK